MSFQRIVADTENYSTMIHRLEQCESKRINMTCAIDINLLLSYPNPQRCVCAKTRISLSFQTVPNNFFSYFLKLHWTIEFSKTLDASDMGFSSNEWLLLFFRNLIPLLHFVGIPAERGFKWNFIIWGNRTDAKECTNEKPSNKYWHLYWVRNNAVFFASVLLEFQQHRLIACLALSQTLHNK